MARRVFDTSVLIRHWRRRAPASLSRVRRAEAERWARELIELHESDAILTPVFVEFVAGTRSSTELNLAHAYLKEFRVLDGGTILAEDWREARRLAERVPRNSKPRQLGDCLIRAIAARLKHDVETADTGFPH